LFHWSFRDFGVAWQSQSKCVNRARQRCGAPSQVCSALFGHIGQYSASLTGFQGVAGWHRSAETAPPSDFIGDFLNLNNNLAFFSLNGRDKQPIDPSARFDFRENSNETWGGALPEIRCHPAPPRHPFACGSLDKPANLRLCRRRKRR
jgi:hypothetical protein